MDPIIITVIAAVGALIIGLVLGKIIFKANVDKHLAEAKLAEEKAVRDRYRISPEITLVKFSDAHYPNDLGPVFTEFNMEEPSFQELRKALRGEDGRSVRIP